MARNLYFLTILLFVGSCSFFDKHEDTPSYIHIKKFSLSTNSAQGTNSNNITDAWVYVNGNSMGVFELPCTIPLLEEGETRITLYAGIKDDGISAIRKIYPFYTNYVIDKNLVRGIVDTISPTCTYFDAPQCYIDKEEFEDAGVKFVADVSSTINVTKTNVAGEVFEDQFSGKFEMNAADVFMKAFYTPNFQFPGNGLQAYVELNYKNNMTFTIGLETSEPLNIEQTDNTHIKPSYDDNGNLVWKKIYINLTDLINLHPNATNYRVYIKAVNIDAQDGLFVLLDNFKVVYAD
jgi:hypothetical protein